MDFTAYDIALIPLIMAIVELVGRIGVPRRFLPAVALVLGLAAGFIYVAPSDPPQAVLVGLVMGLSSVGAYSGVKNTLENKGPGD